MQPVHVVLHWAAREGLVSECTVRESGRAALFIATPTTTGEIDARVDPRCLAHEGQQSLRRGCKIQPPALGVVEGRAVITTIVHMVNSGGVRLCGTFSGSRIDLREVDWPWLPAA